jgi:hypothetical protein
MSLQLGSTPITGVKLGTTHITSIYIGATLVWSSTGIRDDADRQDAIGLGSNWTDLGPALTPNLASVYSRYFRMNMEDAGTTQSTQTDRQVYNAAVSPADDGYLETVPLTEGDSGLQTIVWRRANVTLTNGVGIHLRSGEASIVSRISNTEVVRTPTGRGFQPGDIIRLTQEGNVHSLRVAGGDPVVWNDSGGLAAVGASFRSMGLTMQGSRILQHGRGEGGTQTDEYVRQYSPALEFVEMGSDTPMAGYVDAFDRADSTTTLGSDWTPRRNTLGINSNAAYGVDDATNYGTYNTPMGAEDVQVNITLGTIEGTGADVYIWLGANTTGEGVLCRFLNNDRGNIYSKTGWSIDGTSRATASSNQTLATGDVFSLRRIGNVYTALKNGTPIAGQTWTDYGNVVPRNSSHRLAGLGVWGGTNYRRINTWQAFNL